MKETRENYFQYRKFPVGYGQFPYILIKVAPAIYMQIPIHFVEVGKKTEWKKYIGTHVEGVDKEILKQSRESQIFLLYDKIMEVTHYVIRKTIVYSKKEVKACLVLGKKQAIFYEDGNYTRKNIIPGGGTLLDQMNNIIAMNVKHYLEDIRIVTDQIPEFKKN